MIKAFWCLSDNFGDKLTSYLFEKISKKKCIWVDPNSEAKKYIAVGSILNWEIKNCIVWGCGIASIIDCIPPHEKILCVRGPLSLQRLKECQLDIDTSQIVLGDPALLLPRFYNPNIQITHDLGIFPHYVDLEFVYDTWFKEPVKIINPLDSVENVINQILSCKRILSSSLHGLIVADVYGKETQWIKITDKILGDGTKYYDYYSSIGVNSNCISIIDKDILKIQTSKKKISQEVVDKILKSCPVKND